MPKIKMISSAKGADDGFTVRTYEKGQEYDVSDDLAREFVASGAAICVGGKVDADADAPAILPTTDAVVRRPGRPRKV